MLSTPKAIFQLLLLVLCTCFFVKAQWSNSTTCASSEVSGIDQCQSAGSGFTMDQKKNEACPQLSIDTDPSAWSCDQWKCHMYCSNPVRPDARKSCTNCDEVEVGDACWEERQVSCDAAKAALDGCDVVCSAAVARHGSGVWKIGFTVAMGLAASWQLVA